MSEQNDRKQTILAVDDTPENLDVVKSILVSDYVVKAAVNGKMALKIAEAQQPDLILLDIMMPEMDGYEVCRLLKSNPATARIPVIFLTAKDETENEAKGFELGAADYILKPVSPPILTARVKTHLELKSQMEQLETAFAIIKRQKDRMEQELTVAGEIQARMVPPGSPALPGRGDLDLWAALHPAREVGGDLYDFQIIDDDRLCFCVGDVSGKGVPAALFMAITKTLIKARSLDDPSTASIVTKVNDALNEGNDTAMFVTLFVGILDLSTGNCLLDDDPFVVGGGECERRVDFFDSACSAHSDGGTHIGGFHEDRAAQVGQHVSSRRIGDFIGVEPKPGSLGHAGRCESVLRRNLVHGQRAAQDPSARVGNVGQLAQTLDGAILAHRAMQKRQNRAADFRGLSK